LKNWSDSDYEAQGFTLYVRADTSSPTGHSGSFSADTVGGSLYGDLSCSVPPTPPSPCAGAQIPNCYGMHEPVCNSATGIYYCGGGGH